MDSSSKSLLFAALCALPLILGAIDYEQHRMFYLLFMVVSIALFGIGLIRWILEARSQ